MQISLVPPVGLAKLAVYMCKHSQNWFPQSTCNWNYHMHYKFTPCSLIRWSQGSNTQTSLLTHKMVQYPDLTCVSKCKIPFDLPINLSAVLRMSTAERYRMCNNVAQLVPQSLSIACTKCSQISWNDPYLEHNAVSTNEFLNAQG